MDNQNNSVSSEDNGGNNGSQSAPPSMENDMLLGIFSYLGPLIIISFVLTKDKKNPFVKFHIKQGLILFIAEIIVWMFGSIWTILNIVNLAAVIYAILGVINVIQHKEKELPFIGYLSNNFKF